MATFTFNIQHSLTSAQWTTRRRQWVLYGEKNPKKGLFLSAPTTTNGEDRAGTVRVSKKCGAGYIYIYIILRFTRCTGLNTKRNKKSHTKMGARKKSSAHGHQNQKSPKVPSQNSHSHSPSTFNEILEAVIWVIEHSTFNILCLSVASNLQHSPFTAIYLDNDR